MDIDIKKVRTVFCELNKFDHMAKDDSFIQVTEWANGEGWDVAFDNNRHISLTFGELDAINYMVKTLDLIGEKC